MEYQEQLTGNYRFRTNKLQQIILQVETYRDYGRESYTDYRDATVEDISTNLTVYGVRVCRIT